jgi:hypothetical protein
MLKVYVKLLEIGFCIPVIKDILANRTVTSIISFCYHIFHSAVSAVYIATWDVYNRVKCKVETTIEVFIVIYRLIRKYSWNNEVIIHVRRWKSYRLHCMDLKLRGLRRKVSQNIAEISNMTGISQFDLRRYFGN